MRKRGRSSHEKESHDFDSLYDGDHEYFSGSVYPLVVTGLAQMLFPKQANGSLIVQNGKARRVAPASVSRSRRQDIFVRARRRRRSGLRSHSVRRIQSRSNEQSADRSRQCQRPAASADEPRHASSRGSCHTSGSGLDPDITPAAAEFQIPRVAKERGMSEAGSCARSWRNIPRDASWDFSASRA